jgi:hypothetical protein
MAAPVQAAPVQAAPVQAAPVQAAPVQAAPVQADPNAMTPAAEEELSLDELLAELENEEECGTNECGDEPPMDGDPTIDELLAEIELESGNNDEPIGDEPPLAESYRKLNSSYQSVLSERNEAIKTVQILRNQINEVNLLNAKLLYTNKLFKQFHMNNDQKMRVVENFDLTTSVREVKLTYANMCAIMAESFNLGGSVVKKRNTTATTITEGLASRAVASTKPTQKIVTDVNTMAERFKTLAGIKK